VVVVGDVVSVVVVVSLVVSVEVVVALVVGVVVVVALVVGDVVVVGLVVGEVVSSGYSTSPKPTVLHEQPSSLNASQFSAPPSVVLSPHRILPG
jgi:hypothetical protein